MATDLTDGRAAMLAFARELRRAISAREEMMQEALYAYDQAAGDCLDFGTIQIASPSRTQICLPAE